MSTWQQQIKKGLRIALKSHKKSQAANQLRHAAKKAYRFGENQLALDLITLCLQFAEGSNLYMLALDDFSYYKTGKHLNESETQITPPSLTEDLPWEQLENFITNL